MTRFAFGVQQARQFVLGRHFHPLGRGATCCRRYRGFRVCACGSGVEGVAEATESTRKPARWVTDLRLLTHIGLRDAVLRGARASSPSHTIMARHQAIRPRINNLRVILGQNEGKIPQIARSFVIDGLGDGSQLSVVASTRILASDDQLLLAQSDKQPSDGNFGESASISNSP